MKRVAGEQLYIPKPTAVIATNHRAIAAHYVELRPMCLPADALRLAITRALSGLDLDEVVAFFDGKRDGFYGPGSGARLRRGLQENLEECFGSVQKLTG